MQELEILDRAASQYRLAWLLTGEREASVDATLNALEAGPDPHASFAEWMSAWSRRLMIARVLTGIRGKLAQSARRTASIRLRFPEFPAGGAPWSRETTVIQLERALLAVDLFPRCALVLTHFERISVEDAAILLDATTSLVRKARSVGWMQLIDHLLRPTVRTSVRYQPFVITTGVQHA
jgi:DNA-directed RNA polymerase specialized sigma24 family protein